MENSICCSDALENGRLCEQASNPRSLAAFSSKNTSDLEAAHLYTEVLLNARSKQQTHGAWTVSFPP